VAIIHLLFVLLISTFLFLGSSSGTFALDTTRATTTIRRCKSKVDMFLRVKTDDKGGNVDDLFADSAFFR
jgi:hypothetical protein